MCLDGVKKKKLINWSLTGMGALVERVIQFLYNLCQSYIDTYQQLQKSYKKNVGLIFFLRKLR
jgi:flavoprotein